MTAEDRNIDDNSYQLYTSSMEVQTAMTKLKKLREASGVSREDFARLTNVTQARLEKHEQGRHRISLEDASTYARHLAPLLHATPSKLLADLAGISDSEPHSGAA